jgi:hypothetical protein
MIAFVGLVAGDVAFIYDMFVVSDECAYLCVGWFVRSLLSLLHISTVELCKSVKRDLLYGKRDLLYGKRALIALLI